MPVLRIQRGRVTRGLLMRYRVMAYTTAVLLLVLVFAGIPLQLAAGRPGVVRVVGTMHGFLYIVYLCVAFELTWRLRIPKWQMLLVLLAGTVPFCGFVAERKMTRRVEALASTTDATVPPAAAASARGRWRSRRAILLHCEVALVAPACIAAGWWQTSVALSGNELSWVYSIEWPIFAILAIAGWWHLLHEDPDAYEARKRLGRSEPSSEEGATRSALAFDPVTARLAATLTVLVGVAALLGVAALFFIPIGRPAGWLPVSGKGVYLAHASMGAFAALAGIAFLVRCNPLGRTERIVAWTGLAGLAVAGAGGLLTAGSSLVRFLGIAVMFGGSAITSFAYVVPAVRRQRQVSPARTA